MYDNDRALQEIHEACLVRRETVRLALKIAGASLAALLLLLILVLVLV